MANQPKHEFQSVNNCPHCGQDHESVEFQAYSSKTAEGGQTTRWWGNCPVTGAPIMGKVEQDQPGKTVLGGSERK